MLQLSSEWRATNEFKKINWSSTFKDDIKSLVSHQRKISNISCTFSIFNDDHYLKALNYHPDYGCCTRGNNHLQLYTTATQVTYKRDNQVSDAPPPRLTLLVSLISSIFLTDLKIMLKTLD